MSLVYQYIAQSNPIAARNVISSFGYQRTAASQGLGNDLKVLVAQEGEPALKAVMDLHPDKDILLDIFSTTESKPKPKKCGCHSTEMNYHNATGNAAVITQAGTLSSQGNTFILAAALMLAVAIIVKN